jgi:hypothetical protein
MTKLQTLSLAATLACTVLCASFGLAQDPGKPRDEALDSLLEKLDNARAAVAEKNKADVPAKPGDVSTKDKALDSLLEKLGETPDKPSPDERPKGAPGPQKEKPPGQPGKEKSKADQLKGAEKNLDEHLEELTGRKPKKKDGDGEGTGPLSKVIKEMRDVEKRLGKTDTGDETRKKQTEIVKNLETLIEQLRESQSQSQGKKKQYLVMKPGTKPGQKDGQDQGAMAKGVGPQKPEKPTNKHALVGGEGDWGHLPPELRQEMVNVFKEDGLPGKADWIRRYYLSVSKKLLIRGE